MLFRSLPLKRMARDVIEAYALCEGLVYDVQDTDCRSQNGRPQGCVFGTF